MNFRYFISVLLVTIVWKAFPALAQGGDVCCILGKITGESSETRAELRSAQECARGNTVSGYTVCDAKPDPENLCSTTSEESRCKSCGYHWTGKICLAFDPVAKAKEVLEKEGLKKPIKGK